MKFLPSKHAVITGLVVFAVGMYLYNRVLPANVKKYIA